MRLFCVCNSRELLKLWSGTWAIFSDGSRLYLCLCASRELLKLWSGTWAISSVMGLGFVTSQSFWRRSMHPPLPTTSLLQASFWGQTTVHQTFFICEMHSWWTGIYTQKQQQCFFSRSELHRWVSVLGFFTALDLKGNSILEVNKPPYFFLDCLF